jgi:excinuclease UvrABC ATPase subunit
MWEAALRPEPALFSFNSPLGVCPTCRGFGNVLTFTLDLVVPDPSLTLREGAIRPWAGSWRKVFWPKLEKFARERKIPLDRPWKTLAAEDRRVLIEAPKAFAARSRPRTPAEEGLRRRQPLHREEVSDRAPLHRVRRRARSAPRRCGHLAAGRSPTSTR